MLTSYTASSAQTSTHVSSSGGHDVISSSNPRFSDDMKIQAELWLYDCHDNHNACNRARLEASRTVGRVRPTRLLDISRHSFVRLASGEDPTMSKPYSTMSHCWGLIDFYKLTKDTYAELVHGIPISRLTKTFQEGIEVARSLGLEAMWIDSLCIFQDKDDLSDWRKECGRMADIYQCSAWNIAATAGLNGNEGCYAQTQERWLVGSPTVFFSNNYVIQGSTGYKVVPRGWYAVVPKEFVQTGLAQQPLCNRGWVVQERLLAPRTLHFSASEMFWECLTLFACETFPCGVPNSILGMDSARPETKRWNAPESLEQNTRDEIWDSIVKDYTRCSLTKQTDKLIALAGIAKAVQRVFNDHYLAGLWGSSLPMSLLWEVTRDSAGSKKSGKENDSYRAPSWSWAAIDDIPTFTSGLGNENVVAKIVSCSMEPMLDSEPTGQLRSGSLRIRGPLLDIESLQRDYRYEKWKFPLCRTSHSMPCWNVDARLDSRVSGTDYITQKWTIRVLVIVHDLKNGVCWGLIIDGQPYRRVGILKFEHRPGPYFSFGKPYSYPNFDGSENEVVAAYLEHNTRGMPLLVFIFSCCSF
jgi:hypothetical protein